MNAIIRSCNNNEIKIIILKSNEFNFLLYWTFATFCDICLCCERWHKLWIYLKIYITETYSLTKNALSLMMKRKNCSGCLTEMKKSSQQIFPMSRKKPLKNTRIAIGKFLKSANGNPLSWDLSLVQRLSLNQ